MDKQNDSVLYKLAVLPDDQKLLV